MNKIVREHYPASRLPKELREGLEDHVRVTVIVEEQMKIDTQFEMKERKPFTALEAVEAIKRFKEQGRPSIDSDEAVARIRALRDEWEDE
ncbi:hypothetical protein OIU34_09340 [Pararhizobium sp. BT-229]|uniref:hypothetical protein n=1 Tax=Pararhizobium sp. BT-229 TaxID=2986923 RepID=UPI0021F6DD53|nr:hypothetical protein [Pararhizobium sp. BT-229]MCV9962103.1 hypothetical protein [Pararhizobium sp. BT-229]